MSNDENGKSGINVYLEFERPLARMEKQLEELEATQSLTGRDHSATIKTVRTELQTARRELYANLDTCPDKYILWFHRVSWDHRLSSGRTLWEEFIWRYYDGVRTVETMNAMWDTLKPYVDEERFQRISERRQGHLKHARKWRDTCVKYYQSVTKRPWPDFIVDEFHLTPGS